MGEIYLQLGDEEKSRRAHESALEMVERQLAVNPQDALHGPTHVEQLARIYTLVDEYDKALEQLDRLFSIPGWYTPEWIDTDPEYDPLRGHPRYEEVLGKHRAK